MSGVRKTASGQRRSASAALIAERMPKPAGGVARRGDHAPAVRVAAHHHRPPAQLGAPVQLDRGEERVDVEVRDHGRAASLAGPGNAPCPLRAPFGMDNGRRG